MSRYIDRCPPARDGLEIYADTWELLADSPAEPGTAAAKRNRVWTNGAGAMRAVIESCPLSRGTGNLPKPQKDIQFKCPGTQQIANVIAWVDRRIRIIDAEERQANEDREPLRPGTPLRHALCQLGTSALKKVRNAERAQDRLWARDMSIEERLRQLAIAGAQANCITDIQQCVFQCGRCEIDPNDQSIIRKKPPVTVTSCENEAAMLAVNTKLDKLESPEGS